MNQVKKNLFINVFSLIINILIAIFYTPYLVRSLGIFAYGLIPLALLINQYLNVFTGSLTSSLTRFYTVSIENKNYKDAEIHFNTSLNIINLIVIFLIIIILAVMLNISSVFNIPDNYISASRILFSFSSLGFILALYSSVLNIVLYAKNRLDVINFLKILRSIFSVILTVVFFESITNEVEYIGYSIFLSELIVLFSSYYFFKSINQEKIKINLRKSSKYSFSSLSIMSFWVMLHQIGDVSIYKFDNLVINKFWSLAESGVLGAISQFGTYIILVIGTISSLFGPIVLIAYGSNDHEKVKKLSLDNSLIIGLLSSIFVGICIGFGEHLLVFWLGSGFDNYYFWLIAKLISIPFYSAAGIYSFVFRSWNKVVIPAIVTVAFGVINIVASIIISSASKGDPNYIIYVLVLNSIFVFFQAYLFSTYYLTTIYPSINYKILFIQFTKISLSLIFVCVLSIVYRNLFDLSVFYNLIFGIFIISFLTVPLVFYFSFDSIIRERYLASLRKISIKLW